MRIVQSGVGGFGGSWLWAIRECEGFEHVALVDPNRDALDSAGDLVGVPPAFRFTSLQDALRVVQADGLVDVSPAPAHPSTCIAAMEAGLHVLVEKPIAETMADARAMCRCAERTGRTLMVTQQYRYQDQPRHIRHLIEHGEIGALDHVVVEFQIQGLLSGWRKHMRHPFLMDMAVHHFDLMRYIIGTEARSVLARTWNPQFSNTDGDMNAFVWLEFDGGVRVNYTGTFAAPGQDTGWNGRWVITGSRGSIVWNQRDDWGPVRIARQYADLAQFSDQHFFTPLAEPWGEPVPAPSIGPTGHHYDLYHWRACIEQHVEPETSGRDNLNTLAIALAAGESADTGHAITLDCEPALVARSA